MNARGANRLLEGPPTNLVLVTATASLDLTMHLRPIVLKISGGAGTISLPVSQGQGLILNIIVGVIAASTGYVINTNGTDVFAGFADSNTAGATPATAWWSSTANKTFTLNGTTTGGAAIGDNVILTDIIKGTWAIQASVTNTGSVATPFSN